ncbi:ABC transporter permease [Ollibium composti]|uniref:ABC transporter permease n=1 Tax=Ollibium composti TaxID=2675109 RepID=A0ABY2QCS1_9HYPH|nr:ABC transporter permease [Mesorhizobium composti]THF60072.1 ABC transporter permease [Mesorhizobium composti]
MMRLELVKRPQRSALFSALSPFIAFALTLIAGAILFALLGIDPVSAFYTYFISPISEVWQLHELAIKAAPLILIAVGLSVCYRANIWNIGAEGQFTLGAIVGSMVPVLYPELEGPIVLPLMLLMGMIGGGLYAAIPAYLKARFNTNEILTSLMLVYVSQLFLDWLVRGPWRDPQGHGFPQTVQFNDSAILPELMPASGRANWGFVFALVAAVVVWIMMSRMLKGFEVRVLGSSPRAGRFAGFGLNRMIFFAFILSGALAGLAGISVVSGEINQLKPVISPGYGFAAIIVAFLGRLNPLGIVAAGLVLALTYLGGEAAQTALGVSDKVARVFQGMLLFFVLGCDTLIHYRIRLVGLRAKAPAPDPATAGKLGEAH